MGPEHPIPRISDPVALNTGLSSPALLGLFLVTIRTFLVEAPVEAFKGVIFTASLGTEACQLFPIVDKVLAIQRRARLRDGPQVHSESP